MDYFNDVLLHFWALNVSVLLLSMEGQKDFIKNILICIPKMNGIVLHYRCKVS